MKLFIIKIPSEKKVVVIQADESGYEYAQIGVLEVSSISGIQYLDYEHMPDGDLLNGDSASIEWLARSVFKAFYKMRGG